MYIYLAYFTAPENQALQNCSILSDMFSLGLVMCAIFNSGRPLIQAGNSPSAYTKQLETVSIKSIVVRVAIYMDYAKEPLS